jgi:hypothetical protein
MKGSKIRLNYNDDCTPNGNPRKGSGMLRGTLCDSLIIINRADHKSGTTLKITSIGGNNIPSEEWGLILDQLASERLRNN